MYLNTIKPYYSLKSKINKIILICFVMIELFPIAVFLFVFEFY